MAKRLSKLGRDDELKAKLLQQRLSDEYEPLFTELNKFYRVVKPNSKEDKTVASTLAKIKRAIRLCARVFLGAGVTATSLPELAELNTLVKEIEQARVYIIQIAAQDNLMKERLDEISSYVTAVPVDQMNLAVELSRKAKREYKKESSGHLGWIGSILDILGINKKEAAVLGVASQLAAPLLGPFYQLPALAYGGYQTARGLGKLGGWGLGKVASLFGFGRKKSVIGGISSTEGMPDIGGVPLSSPSKTLSPVTPSEPISSAIDDRGFPTSGLSGSPGTPFRLLSRTKKEMATEPLYYFFDKRAYRAGWTKDVLHELKRIGKGGEGGGLEAGLLGGVVAGAVVSALKIVGLVGAAAFATIQVGRAAISVIGLGKTLPELGRNIVKPRTPFLDWMKKRGYSREDIVKQFGKTPEEMAAQEQEISKVEESLVQHPYQTATKGLMKDASNWLWKTQFPFNKIGPWLERKAKAGEIGPPTSLQSITTIEGEYKQAGIVSSRELTQEINQETRQMLEELRKINTNLEKGSKLNTVPPLVGGPYRSVERVVDEINSGADVMQDR